MNFPEDIYIKILSFIDNNQIRNMDLPYKYYSKYLKERLPIKNELWYKGVYYNMKDKCFLCETPLKFYKRIMVICMNCDIAIDNYYYYPQVCIDCIKKRSKEENFECGKIFRCSCPSCNTERMNLAIQCYS